MQMEKIESTLTFVLPSARVAHDNLRDLKNPPSLDLTLNLSIRQLWRFERTIGFDNRLALFLIGL